MNGMAKYTVVDIASLILNFDNEEQVKANNKSNDNNIIGAVVNVLNKIDNPINKYALLKQLKIMNPIIIGIIIFNSGDR